ncbi:MAG: carboxymuconolactone decarboxylase family protein [Jatrophihabitans sp.]
MRLKPDEPILSSTDALRLRAEIVSSRSSISSVASVVDQSGALLGPFACLPYTPQIGDAVQRVGAALRAESVLPRPLTEAVILSVAVHWRADYEWYAHAAVARAVLSEEDIALIGRGELPADEAIAVAVRLAREVMAGRRAGDEVYDAVAAHLGAQGTAELVMFVGYYSMLAMLIITFDTPIPDDVLYPWSE